MDLKKNKNKEVDQGSETVCSSRANSSGHAVTPWDRRSLLPHPGQSTTGFPLRRHALHSLAALQPQAPSPASSVSGRLLVPLQKWRKSTTIFHQVPLGTEGGKKEAEGVQHLFLTGCSGKLARGLRGRVSCPGAVSCWPAHLCSCTSGTTRWRLKFKSSFHSVGRYQVGRVVWTGETEGAALVFRTAGLFYEDSTGAQQLAHCLVWLHVWVLFFVFIFVFFFSFAFAFSF